jgi:hypothetical protein
MEMLVLCANLYLLRHSGAIDFFQGLGIPQVFLLESALENYPLL